MFLNPHKVKKKWKRRVSRAKDQILYPDSHRHPKQDFAWHARKSNPLQREEQGYKKKIEVIILALTIPALLGTMLFHSFFSIKNITIVGLQNIPERDILTSVHGILEYDKWYVFKGNNYFLLETQEMDDILSSRFPFKNLVIKKQFPNTLSIIGEEKLSTVIYDNGAQYAYVGHDGKVVEILRHVGDDEWIIRKKMVTSTNALGVEEVKEEIIKKKHTPPVKALRAEMGEYPIVYDLVQKEVAVNVQILDPAIMTNILDWFQRLRTFTNIPLNYFILHDDIGNAVLKTAEGWEIRLRLDKSVDEQFHSLTRVLKEEIPRPNFQYIDLRFSEKVYWQ